MGVNAAYVGWIAWPNAFRIAKPIPSLPVVGTDRPPVATITASTASGAPPWRSTSHPPVTGLRPVTAVPGRKRAPLRAASARRPSRTSRARFEAGKSLAVSASSTSGIPSSRSKKAICSASGHERRILRRVWGEESVTKRRSSTREGRMLQRPPPLMRILRPPSLVRSSSSDSAPQEAAKIAAMVPAAPAPIVATRRT